MNLNSETLSRQKLMDEEPRFRNLYDYVAEEQSSLSERAFCAEDGLVFSQLAYLHMGDYVKEIGKLPTFSVPLKKLADPDVLDVMTRSIRSPESARRLLTLAAASRRFKNVKVKYFAEHTDLQTQKQFSAVTFLLDHRTAFVAFRGTDNTIVGWRENFNMAFMSPVPSQAEGAEYLKKVINRLRTRRIYVGGHSKGGNLAVYAAMNCGHKEQLRIDGVYNFDGPGFKNDAVLHDNDNRIGNLMKNIIPQGSMIGTLLKSPGTRTVIHSEGSGFEQHNPLNWTFTGNHLTTLSALSRDAIVFDTVIDNWLERISDSQRELIVDTVFDIISHSGAKTFNDALEMIKSGDISAFRVLRGMSPETRRKILPLLKSLGIEYLKARISK